MTYSDGEGRSITISEAGLLAATHKQGMGAVDAYFDEYADDIKSGKKVSPSSERYINVQKRMRWAQDIGNP